MSKPRWDKVLLDHKSGKLEYRHYYAGNKPMNMTYVIIAKGNHVQLWYSLTEYLLKNSLIKVPDLIKFLPKDDVGRLALELNVLLMKKVDDVRASFKKKKAV